MFIFHDMDADGNTYTPVKIGNQVWMAENLKTTKYNDGSAIPNVTDEAEWGNLSTPAYSWYDNNPANKETYGALYNWYAVDPNRNGGKNICPPGWHIPTDDEWTTLINHLGGESVAGGKMKAITGWDRTDEDTTNSSGFTALASGYRHANNGSFPNVGYLGYWWSATAYDASNAWLRLLNYYYANVGRDDDNKRYGLSVRCIRD